MALGSTITQVTKSGLKPGLQFPSLVVSGILTSTNFKTGTTDVHSTGVTAATSVVGSAVTSNSTGIIVTGVTTSNSFVGALTGNVSGGTVAGSTGTFSSDVTISGDLGVAGTLTYEDVARVDAIGLSTYREGLHIGPLAGIGLTAYKDGSIRSTGIITATTFGSDTNSIFTTGGSERLRITSVGKVFIGSTSDHGPSAYNLANAGLSITAAGENILRVLDSTSYAADVGGAILIGGNYRSSGDTQPFVELKSFKENATDANYAYGFRIGTTPNGGSITERLRITSTGNVGINDTDPSYVLNVIGDNAASNGTGMLKGIIGVQNDTTALGSSPTAGISFQTKYRTGPDVPLDVASIWGGKENTSNGDKDGYMGFATREEGGSGTQERMRITSSGDLGLGITPVLQDSGARTLHIHHPTSGSPARSHIRLTTGTSGSAADNGALLGLDYSNNLYLYNHEAGEIIFGSNNVKRMVLRNDGNIHISKNVNLTGNTNSNLLNERVQILPSEANGYEDSHILSCAQTRGNWYDDGQSGSTPGGASGSWGWLWQYASANNAQKKIRAGIAYDHVNTEELKYWSSYGAHTWYVDGGKSGDETAETCDRKAMQINHYGSVINTSQPDYGIYTHGNVQTSDGGQKNVQYLEDCMGQWIVVAKIQQSSHLQAAMASVYQIDSGTGQATGTEWSASFGNTYPVAVRYVSSSDWKNWRDTRGVDFIQGVPHGRKWKNFFTNGASSGMTQATGGVGSAKYGWTCDGAWDGKGRWHNPTFNWWRMSDTANFSASMVSSTFFTTPTAANAASALSLNFASDAKFGVHATAATGGQDTEVTSAYGYDDNAYAHEDNYPSSPANHAGSDITAMPLWICLNVSSVGQFH